MTPLPPLLVLTDGAQAAAAGQGLREVLDAATAAGGAEVGVVLRERQLAPGERAGLVAWAGRLAAGRGSLLVVASPGTAPGQNLHLRAAEPLPHPRPPLLGRSCHGAAELAAAAAEGAAYATFSPVYATASKPGYGPQLGIAALGGAPLPVYALGGVTAATAATCCAAGAAGVAVMGAVMRARDPGAAVAGLLDALGGARPTRRRGPP